MKGYEILRSGRRKLRISTEEAARLEIKDVIRGVYLAKKAPFGYIISIEGSYIIGKLASKHVAELSKFEFSRWMKGEDIIKDLPDKGVYLVRFGSFYAGSGYYDGRVLRNLIPKTRTVEA